MSCHLSINIIYAKLILRAFSVQQRHINKLVFVSEIPPLPLDDPSAATVADWHYHSWNRVHLETSLLLLTSVQIVCPWQLLTVITKPGQYKHTVVINALYKVLPLNVVNWLWEAPDSTEFKEKLPITSDWNLLSRQNCCRPPGRKWITTTVSLNFQACHLLQRHFHNICN